MAIVEPFQRGMLESFLRRRQLRYLTDQDGDVHVSFGYDPNQGCSLRFLLMAAGSKENILAVRVWSDKRIPRSEWGRAVMACNTWNRENRWPKAYLETDDGDTDTGAISLDLDIPLAPGIHQELLDEILDVMFFGGGSFWEWAHKEHVL